MFWRKEKFKIVIKGNNFFNRHLGLLLSVLALCASLAIGIYAGKKIQIAKYNQAEIKKLINKDAKPDFLISKDIDFNLFWQVWEKIKKDYAYQPVDEIKMFYGAVEGMTAALGDPYSVFFEPQIAEEFQKDLAGEFEGIGAEIGIKNDFLIVVAPLLDSPAEKAGLKAGDKILAIDDKDTRGMVLDAAVKLIRGEKGTAVKLTIARDGTASAKDYEIVRNKIVIKSVQWRMEKDVAYIKVLQFGNDTSRDFDNVVGKVILKNPKGIILDLRNNPGGYLDAAIKMAGEWIPDDPVVLERFKGRDEEFRANGKGRLKDFKTVVLINRGSASASEIVSGALKDTGKATIVGEKSYGKGSVQDYNEYSGGAALKLTIALWLTPNGTSINGQGIEPNIAVEITEEDARASKDPQLEKALELLK